MLLRRFDWHYIGQIYGGDFAKFCGLLKVSELYLRYTVRIPIAIPGQIGLLMGPSRFSWYLLLLLLNLHLYLSMSDGNMLSVDRVFLGSLNQSWLGKIKIAHSKYARWDLIDKCEGWSTSFTLLLTQPPLSSEEDFRLRSILETDLFSLVFRCGHMGNFIAYHHSCSVNAFLTEYKGRMNIGIHN